MVEAVKVEVRQLRSARTWIFYALFLLYPTVIGIAMMPAYEYTAPIDSFTLMTGTPVSIVFPLLLTGLYVFRFSGLLQNRYAFYARFRSGTGAFLSAHMVVNILVVGVLVFLSYVIAAVAAFLVLPHTAFLQNLVGYRPLPAGRVAEYTTSVETFTQLAAYGTWVYVLVFSLFVAVFSMAIATASLGFTLLTRSRILGLSATLVLFTVENFVLSYARVEQFRSVTAIFPGGIIQQSLWVPVIPLVAWVVLAGVLMWWARRSAERLDTLA